MSIWTKAFWKDAIERVVSTAAQAAVGVLTADGFNLVEFDLKAGASVVGVAALVSLLKALVANEYVEGTVSPASLVK